MGILGYLVFGDVPDGWTLVGAAIALVFSGTTTLSMLRTSHTAPGKMMAVIMGTWLGKLAVVVVVLAVLRGMAFYDHARFPAWQHSLFVGALAGAELIRLQLEGDRVVGEERLLGERKARIRDVRVGPDGYLYLLTDSGKGQLLKVGLE